MKLAKGPLRIVAVVALLGGGIWAAVDLWGPRSTNIRHFDSQEVARLETRMWRSYYAKERARLFNDLALVLRRQYNMPFLRSNVVAFHAARAAFVFKDGKSRTDYERALPDLVNYYAAIQKVSETPFNIDRAARLELEWWIVHRERNTLPIGALDRALADLASEIYQLPAAQFTEHARARAKAMLIRDQRDEEGGVTEGDWKKIDDLLQESWLSLWQKVNRGI